MDMKIQTDTVLEHNKPDIVILKKESRVCTIIDVSCPFDTRVVEKEKEKLDRYQDLKWELKRIWNCREVKVVPIVTGALVTVSNNFQMWLNQVSQNIYFGTLQKAGLGSVNQVFDR